MSASAPPPSRREARRQLRREAIVEVASQSFLENGYAGTTMSDIAALLGGSKGTLWSYFPCKEELFDAVLDQLTRAYRAELSLMLAPGGDAESTLRRFCTQFLTKVMAPDRIALYRLVVRATARFPEVGRMFHECGPKLTQQQLSAYLADAAAGGEFVIADPLAAARQLIALCLAGSHQSMLMGVIETLDPGRIEADVDAAMSVFLRAYRRQ